MASLTTQITIAGNLTRDVEVRYTQSGQAVASFAVASTPRSYDRDKKEYVDGETIFTNCTVWGKPAEYLAASASKGSRVIAAGSLKTRKYEDREGNQKSATELVVDEVGVSVAFTAYQRLAATGGGRPEPVSDEWSRPDRDGDTPW